MIYLLHPAAPTPFLGRPPIAQWIGSEAHKVKRVPAHFATPTSTLKRGSMTSWSPQEAGGIAQELSTNPQERKPTIWR